MSSVGFRTTSFKFSTNEYRDNRLSGYLLYCLLDSFIERWDLVEYGDMEQEAAENLAEEWTSLDLIVITNQVYGKHDTEYIVPEPYYNGNSAKIINLGVENF
jgi:hypothetical protein